MACAPRNAAPGPENLFNDIRRRTIVAVGMLRSPLSVLVFILDFCRLAGRALLRGRALGGLHGRFVAPKGLPEYPVELVGPPPTLPPAPLTNSRPFLFPLP